MNTPQNQPDNTHDWHDALLDRSLAEIVGGETPPDLSEKILAAAQKTPSVATLPAQSERTARWQWAGYVVAASLLVGVGVALMFPAINSAGSRPKNLDLARIEHSKDNDATRFAKEQSREPMMTVTPHIIVQGEEEELLGIATEVASEPLTPSATDPTQADEYLKSVVRDKEEFKSRTRSESLSKDKLVEKVEQFNEFRDAQKFEEMERVAKDLYDAAPDEPVAQQVWENAKFIRRKMLDKQLSEDTESGVLRTTSNEGSQKLGSESESLGLWGSASPAEVELRKRQAMELKSREKSAPGPDLSVPFRQNSFAGDAIAPVPQSNMGLKGLINDGYAVEGAQVSAPPVSHDAETWQNLSARRKKYARTGIRDQNPDLRTLSDEVSETQGDHFYAAHGLETRRLSSTDGKQVLEPWMKELYESHGYFFAEPRNQHTSIDEIDSRLVELEARKSQLAVELGGADSLTNTTPEFQQLLEEMRSLQRHIVGVAEKITRIKAHLEKMPKDSPDIVRLGDMVSHFESEKEKLKREFENKRAKLQTYNTPNSELAVLTANIAHLQEFRQRLSASRDQYTPIHENPFVKAIGGDAVSTFSIDVDTASYANVRQFLTQSRQLPPPDAVRIEELINYFDYDYAGPTDNTPFAAHMEVAACPWNAEHRLARIAIKGKEIDREKRPQSNLVFLIDVSGSMNEPNKLPLLVEGMKLLTRELGENDKVAIVVYASTEGVVLESTRGDEQETILAALNRLQAGGSTAGGAGINRAYQIALDNFIEGATNRVILCTDGDFNVGVTNTDDLTRLAEQKAKTGVFLTVLGFGRGNLNDAMMESISGKGNGNYHYVDSLTEARKVLVEEMTGTLITIAKDVKIQVEFNPAKVAGYRLIGYENRMLATEDFNDDKKDAGEIGAGHTVTALYEIIPAGKEVSKPKADPLKYQKSEATFSSMDGKHGGRVEVTGERGGEGSPSDEGFAIKQPQSNSAASNELLTLKLRYKLPDADKSTKLEFPITDKGESFAESTKDFQFAAAVASLGMLLRHSQYQGETSFDAVSEIAQSSLGKDHHGYRAEFLELVRLAKQLSGN